MTYKYVCPTERGYVKFKLTRKQHNEILSNRKVNAFRKIDAYYRENNVVIHYTTTFIGKVLVTLMLPITVVMHGFSSIKEIAGDYKELLNEKRTGSFVSEHVDSKKYNGEPSERYAALELVYKTQRRTYNDAIYRN